MSFSEQLSSLSLKIEKTIGKLPKEHPIIEWIAAAKRNYEADKKMLAYSRACYAQFVLEDLMKIQKYDTRLFESFKSKLKPRPMSLSTYFGLRMEIRVGAALIDGKKKFIKEETPDFILDNPNNLGMECSSVILDPNRTLIPQKLSYKIEATLKKKNTCKFKTPINILLIDMTNLLFHEGDKNHSAELADMDVLKPNLRHILEQSVFTALILYCYAWEPINEGNGATLHSCYIRLDKNKILPDHKEFLDSQYPFGDFWLKGHLSAHV